MKKPQSTSLAHTFARALAACRQHMGGADGAARMAVALSGGIDSSALLYLAHEYAQRNDIALFAFHIHHGISANADAWLAHNERVCAQLEIGFAARRVTLEKKNKTGTEEAARKARYAALGDLCRVHRVTLLLTAHHQDDQAETVLLQLLRGSGMAGLSGMNVANAAPELLGSSELIMARPLLLASRLQLATYVAANDIAYVDDESNDDPRFARNVLRHQVMPALAHSFPGFQERFARSAQHAQSAQRLLIELATQDLAACLDGDSIDIGQLRLLSADRSYNLLRYWFAKRQLRMPSTAWLAEMLTQLLEARPDAQLLVTHPDCHARRHRDHLFLTPKLAELAGTRDDDELSFPGYERAGQSFVWRGEAQLAFPAYGGVLHFNVVENGVEAAWLRGQTLTIDFRKGGERLKLAANRPTRSLKYHYQACNVPAWERERLPTVCVAKELLFAAGIGMDCHHLSDGPAPCIRFLWQSQ